MKFCTFGCTGEHPLNLLHLITLIYMIVFSIIYIIIGIILWIESIKGNKDNELIENISENNNNTIVTSNDLNEKTISHSNEHNQ